MFQVKFINSKISNGDFTIYFNGEKIDHVLLQEESIITCCGGLHQIVLVENKIYKSKFYLLWSFIRTLFGEPIELNPEYAVYEGQILVQEDTIIYGELTETYKGNDTFNQFIVSSNGEQLTEIRNTLTYHDKYNRRYLASSLFPIGVLYLFLMFIFLVIEHIVGYLFAAILTVILLFLINKMLKCLKRANQLEDYNPRL